MTNEERDLTLEYLKEMQEKYIEGYGYEAHPLPEWYALDEAIKALEQQPCEDCISREAVLNIFNEWFATCNIADKRESPKAKIKALPSVKPKYTDEEIDKAQAVEQAYVDKMVELAVEETKRPKGKWIDEYDEVEIYNAGGFTENKHIGWICSECGRFVKMCEKYCPSCGAKMEVEDETNN